MRNSFLIIFSFLTIALNAQEHETPVLIGTNHFIDSKILGETRQIQVALPPDYAESDQRYPVLYVLDGQQYFTHAVSLSSTFRHFGSHPSSSLSGSIPLILNATVSFPSTKRPSSDSWKRRW